MGLFDLLHKETVEEKKKEKIYLQFYQAITMGADPEFFFSDNEGNIVPSDQVIPEKGLPVIIKRKQWRGNDIPELVDIHTTSQIVRDGIQAEINFQEPYICRQILCHQIQYVFETLDKIAAEKKLKLNFSTTVKLNDKQFEGLTPEQKTLGCSPSLNIYDKKARVSVDGSTYPYRSTGGHVHMGTAQENGFFMKNVQKALDTPKALVPVLDAIVGNTCVLLDRDPGQKIRRENYGRAGEYRQPKYGLEYRTLGNFWLRSYPLASLVFSLSRLSVHIVSQSTDDAPFLDDLWKVMDQEKIQRAINTNNMILAYQNFKEIQPVIEKMICPTQPQYTPFESPDMFTYFVRKKMDYWFPNGYSDHWKEHEQRGLSMGWENFFNSKVRSEMATK